MLNVRRAALETLVRILEDGAYANLALKEAASSVDPKDVPYLYALVNETIARTSYLDYVFSHFCKRSFAGVQILVRVTKRRGADKNGHREVMQVNQGPLEVRRGCRAWRGRR